MKFLGKQDLTHPIYRFKLNNLNEVLVPFLEAQGDEIREEQALSRFCRKASARANQ